MNNSSKGELIHDGPSGVKPKLIFCTLRERPMKYQLVGDVMDYQGYDA